VRGAQPVDAVSGVYGLAFKTRLNGASVARRKLVKPAARKMSRNRISPATATLMSGVRYQDDWAGCSCVAAISEALATASPTRTAK
jgi:hypothetical protein